MYSADDVSACLVYVVELARFQLSESLKVLVSRV